MVLKWLLAFFARKRVASIALTPPPERVQQEPSTLHDAVGNPTRLRQLVAAGELLEGRNEEGVTALFYAVITRDLECAEILLAAGADPNAVADEPGATVLAETPLNLAHQARGYMRDDRYSPMIELLKSYGAVDPDWTSSESGLGT